MNFATKPLSHRARPEGLAKARARLLGTTAIVVAVAGLAGSAMAADFDWVGVDATYGTATNWNGNLAGGPNSAGETATFSGNGTATITVGGGGIGPDAWVISNAKSYTIGGGAVTFGTAAGLTNTSTVDQTISNVLGGAGATVTQNGAGTLTLSGANTYTGVTTVSAGTLALENSAAINDIAAVTVAAAGTLNVVDAERIGSLAGSGGLTLGATLTTGDNTNTIFSGDATGAGGIEKVGTGTFTLSGANTHSGDTEVSDGTLILSGGSAIDDNAELIVSAPGVLQVDTAETVGSLDGSGNITLNATLTSGQKGLATAASGIISGAGGMTVAGTGLLSLSGANTYNGLTTVQTGAVLVAASDSALGSTAAGTTVASGGALQLTGGITVDEALTLNGTGEANDGALRNVSGANTTTGVITLGSATRINSDAGQLTVQGGITGANTNLTLGGAGNISVSSAITTGTGTLTKDGGGTASLSAANTYTGQTTVSAGTLNVTAAGSIASTAVLASGTGTLNTDTDALAAGATVTVSGTGTFTSSGTDSFTALTQTGGTVNGSGGLTLSGAFNQSGGTTGDSVDINAATFTQSGGATIAAGTTVTSSGAQTLQGGTIAGTLDGAGAVTVNTDTTTLTGTISAATTITSTLEVDGGDLTNVATLDGGTLAGLSDSTLTGTVVADAGGGTVTAATGSTLTITTLNTANGGALTIGDVGATGTVVAIGNSGANNGSTVAVDAGTLRIGGASAGASLLDFTAGTSVATGATLDIGGFDTTVNALSGTGTVTNSGAAGADLVLTGTSTFGGTIEDGTGGTSLTVTDNTAVGTPSDVTLTGTNSFTGDLKVTSSGANTASLTLQGSGSALSGTTDITLETGGTLNVDSGGAARDYGTLVVNGGTLALDNAFLSVDSLSGTGGTIAMTTTNGAAALTFGSDGSDTTYAGGVTGDTSLTTLVKEGAGTTTLSGTVNTSGSVVVNNGTLALSGNNTFTIADPTNTDAAGIFVDGAGRLRLLSNNAAGGATGRIITTGSVVSYANGVNSATPIVLNSNDTDLEVLGADAATQSGVISEIGGARPIEKVGTGTLTLSANNSYTGETTVTAGTLIVTGNIDSTTITVGTGASLQASGGAALADTAAVTLNGTGNLTLNANEAIGSLASTSGTSTVTLNANTLTTGGNDTSTTFAGVISGGGGLTKAGSGTMTLSGANLFTGDLTINGGTLAVTGGAAIADSTKVVVGSGATFRVDADEEIGALSSAAADAAVNVGANDLSIVGAQNTTYAGTMAGTGTFLNDGTGKLTLTGDGSGFTGVLGATNAGAELAITGAGTTGANGVGSTAGATFSTDGGAILANNAVLGADGQVTFTGSETVGTVTNAAANGNATGTITLTGAGTVLTVNGLANSLNPGSFNGTNGVVNGAGTLNITGGTFNVGGTGNVQTATTIGSGGTVVNNGTMAGVGNAGSFTNNGTAASLNNSGTATNTGTITSGLTNQAGATYTQTAGATNGGTTNAGIVNANGGAFGGAIANNAAGDFNIGGNVTANNSFTNNGTATLDVTGGNFTGITTLTNNSTAPVGINIAASRTLGATSVVNALGATIDNRGTLTSATTIQNNGTFNLFNGSATNGTFTNANLVNASGAATIGGAATNNGTIDLSDAGTNDTLTVTGAFGGNGTVRVDLDVTAVAGVSDKLIVQGASSGSTVVNFSGNSQYGAIANPTLVLDLAGPGLSATETGLVRNFGLVEYDFEQIGSDYFVTSQLNLAPIGGIVGGISTAQSLINAAVNRPSSAFVTTPIDVEADTCAPGGYGRLFGGASNAKATTTAPGSDSAESEVDLTYAGAQIGVDFGCFNIKDTGASVNVGILAGVNTGKADQDQGIGNGTTLLSDNDFDSRYIGIYATYVKESFFADAQVTFDSTSFDINSRLTNSMGDQSLVDNQSPDSDRFTLSGSAGYAFSFDDVSVVPSAGFAYSHTSTDSISLVSNNGNLAFADLDTFIGFASVAVAKTIILPNETSAIQPFVTATIYNDFGDDQQVVYSDSINDPVNTSTQNIGTFGELSLGMNYRSILDPAESKLREFSASVRGDLTFSERLLGGRITGQFRLQF